MNKKTVELHLYAVKAETDKAVKISANYGTEKDPFCFTTWLPKSHAVVDEERKIVTVSEWIYNKYKP